MLVVSKDWIRRFSIAALAIIVAVPCAVMAQSDHVVSPADLQRQAAAVTHMRQENIEKVRSFLSSPMAEETMQKAHIDSGQVKAAVPNLSDEELGQLSARADKAQRDFAAGYLNTRDIALIILGVVVIILIIVIAS
jgi:hypothetical protein